MGPGHAAADNVGGGQQDTSGDGGHAEAGREDEPDTCCGRGVWRRSHLVDGIAAGRTMLAGSERRPVRMRSMVAPTSARARTGSAAWPT